jgi:hypothetical protein
VAVADNSGASPEQTDDGVLWFDPTRPIDVGKNDCAIPLLEDRDAQAAARTAAQTKLTAARQAKTQQNLARTRRRGRPK